MTNTVEKTSTPVEHKTPFLPCLALFVLFDYCGCLSILITKSATSEPYIAAFGIALISLSSYIGLRTLNPKEISYASRN